MNLKKCTENQQLHSNTNETHYNGWGKNFFALRQIPSKANLLKVLLLEKSYRFVNVQIVCQFHVLWGLDLFNAPVIATVERAINGWSNDLGRHHYTLLGLSPSTESQKYAPCNRCKVEFWLICVTKCKFKWPWNYSKTVRKTNPYFSTTTLINRWNTQK